MSEFLYYDKDGTITLEFKTHGYTIVSVAEFDGDSILLVNPIAWHFNGYYYNQVTNEDVMKQLINYLYEADEEIIIPRKSTYGKRNIQR